MKRLSALLAALVLLTGCSGIPTSGDVQVVERDPGHAELPREILPAKPAQDAGPSDIVAGFLTAMADPSGEYAAARLYLTKPSAERWRPSQQSLIYADKSAPGSTAASLDAQLVGRLDSRGAFTPDTAPYTHDFGLVQEDGAWRISNPPDGLLLSQSLFRLAFYPTLIYFWDPSFTSLVPDIQYWPDARRTPKDLVQAVLRGPSQWLQPGVVSAVPRNTQLAAPDVRVDAQGVATIPLTTQVGDLPSRDRTLIAAQFANTLATNVAQTREGGATGNTAAALRILEDTITLDLPGQDNSGAVPFANFLPYAPTSLPNPTPTVVGLRDEQLYTVSDDNAGHPQASPAGAPLAPQIRGVTALAVDTRGERVALLTAGRSQIWLGHVRDARPPELGVTGENFLPPQFTRFGNVWAVGTSGQGSVVYRIVDGVAARVAAPALEGIRVTSFSISPDGVRMLVCGMKGETEVTGLVRINRSGVLELQDFLPVALARDDRRSIVAVGWRSALQMVGLVKDQATLVTVEPDGRDGPMERVRLHGGGISMYPYSNKFDMYNSNLAVVSYEPGGSSVRRVGGHWEPYLERFTALAYPG